MAEHNKVRIGIDVGGTFTHAVAIDHAGLNILSKACRPTTHSAEEGVAKGIWQCLEDLLAEGRFTPDEVIFVAHSTTQATNALLEGDVATVGLMGIVEGAAGTRAKNELSFSNVKISGDHSIKVVSCFTKPDELEKSIQSFIAGEATDITTFAVAEPFAVDNPEHETRAVKLISNAGRPVTASHEVSGLYGLKARARTSIVNASILPKMMDVANRTSEAVNKLGLKTDLMIMRSDGGVMTAEKMKLTPILTILSGPAAGVSAAILYEKIANGLFVEIGGTSTDVSLIRNGKPQSKQAVIGGNVLYLKTLDVRTVAAAGGSMVRVSKKSISDVGPRSAHIAGLPYACFSDPSEWDEPRISFVSPIDGDPGDYAVVETAGGKKFAITTTCAANAAGSLNDDDYSSGNREAALKAFELLSGEVGIPAEELARRVIEIAAGTICAVCRDLVKEYHKGESQLSVVGGGGGASVIAPAVAEILNLSYSLSRDSEVVSAVGAGMAMLKTTIEKSVVDPSEQDIKTIRAAAIEALVEAGADPERVEVEIDVDKQKNTITASATGSSSLASEKSREKIDAPQALKIAADTLGDNDVKLKTAFDDGSCFVIAGRKEKKGFLGLGKKVTSPIVVVDGFGLARLTLPNAMLSTADRNSCIHKLRRGIESGTNYNDGGATVPGAYLVFASRITDLAGIADLEKMIELASLEIEEHPGAQNFCIIISK